MHGRAVGEKWLTVVFVWMRVACLEMLLLCWGEYVFHDVSCLAYSLLDAICIYDDHVDGSLVH